MLRACRQVAKTTLILIGVGHSMHMDPCPMLLVEPTLDVAERLSKRRIAPMIRDTAVLSDIIGTARAKDVDNTILNKTFPGGALTIAGANSPSGLVSEPRKKIFFDEVDLYPATAGPQGDPISVGLESATTFWDRKIVYASTPSIKEISNIDACFEASDQRYFHVPCHKCGKGQKLEWEHVKWESGKPETAMYVCIHCGAGWTDPQRIDAMMEAESLGFGWRAEKPFNGTAGFTLNGIYNVWRPLSVMVAKFLEAKHLADLGNKEKLHSWENNELGQSWEDAGRKADPEPLLARRENYGPGAIPWRILYLTAGVDVQEDRLEIEVVGWRAERRGDPEESWGIEDLVLYGDPSKGEVWAQLDSILKREWTTEDGRHMRLGATCIDSGFKTQDVYDFCNKRIARHVYAIKGMDGPRQIWPRRAGKSRKFEGSMVFTVGTDTAKDRIYSQLKVSEPGPGYCHFPLSYERAFFDQLTSEQVKTRYKQGRPVLYWYKPSGVRNEGLDRRVYAMAALYSRSVPWEILVQSAPSAPPPESDGDGGGEAPPRAPAPSPAPKTGGRKVRFRY